MFMGQAHCRLIARLQLELSHGWMKKYCMAQMIGNGGFKERDTRMCFSPIPIFL
jgi:hypothetical protein